MSELKRHHINEVMDMHNLTRGEMSYSFVYYADDVDKVIAEKDKELCRHKYKRCLAMAWWCSAELGMLVSTAESKIKYYKRWQKRWLKLAEKFKEVER